MNLSHFGDNSLLLASEWDSNTTARPGQALEKCGGYLPEEQQDLNVRVSSPEPFISRPIWNMSGWMNEKNWGNTPSPVLEKEEDYGPILLPLGLRYGVGVCCRAAYTLMNPFGVCFFWKGKDLKSQVKDQFPQCYETPPGQQSGPARWGATWSLEEVTEGIFYSLDPKLLADTATFCPWREGSPGQEFPY